MSVVVLAQKLGHDFSDKDLLRTALTHRSYGTPNNERLEFLGDGVPNFAIASALSSVLRNCRKVTFRDSGQIWCDRMPCIN